MSNWVEVHSEDPRGDTTIEAWLHEERKNLIFVRNDQGLSLRVYETMEDVINGNTDKALADVCYGWYNLLWEHEGRDGHSAFLTMCDEFSANGDVRAFKCHDNAGECEDAFHAAAVLLENEECEGCLACTNNRVSVPDELA